MCSRRGRAYSTLALCWVEARARLDVLVERVVPASEESTADCDMTVRQRDRHEEITVLTRVELVEADPVLPQAREELGLDLAFTRRFGSASDRPFLRRDAHRWTAL